MSAKKEIAKDNYLQVDKLLIRDARPDLAEGLIIARLFDEAAEGFFKSMLGTNAYELIAEAFTKTNNAYSHEHVSIIEYEGAIAGMISGFTTIEKRGFIANILSQSNKGSKMKIMMFSVVGRLLSRYLGPRGDNDYYLEALAVNDPMRGKGLGQKLLQFAEEKAKNKGAATMSLDVTGKNDRAIRTYKKMGMVQVSQWPNFLKLPALFIRMEKRL